MNPLTDREDAAINGVNAALGVILLVSPWLDRLRSSATGNMDRHHRRRRHCHHGGRGLYATARMGGVDQPRGRALRGRLALADWLYRRCQGGW